MPEQASVPAWVVLVVGLGTTISTVAGIFVNAWIARRAAADTREATREARNAAHDASGAAHDAATLVAEVAVKTEEVKVELKAAGQETTSRLTAISEQSEKISQQGEKIHALVNNALSEQLKKYALMAEMLLATDPTNLNFQRLAAEAHSAVEAHAPAESTKEEDRQKADAH